MNKEQEIKLCEMLLSNTKFNDLYCVLSWINYTNITGDKIKCREFALGEYKKNKKALKKAYDQTSYIFEWFYENDIFSEIDYLMDRL